MDELINQFKSIENDVNQNVYEKYQLHQYEQIIEGNDEDVLKKYETMYDQFEEVILNKNNAIQQTNDSINQINDMISYIKKLTDTNNIQSIINKEMDDANTMVKYLNQLVDKILKKETTIFNRKEQEFEQQKQQRKREFEEKQNDIKNMKYNYHNTEEIKRKQHIEKIKFKNDDELEQLNNSIQLLLEWSGKQNYNIIFDSKIHGDGGGVLENRVIHRKNLYFLTFDNENNVFGGYVDNIINKTNDWIKDSNPFVFSLIRNGKIKNIKYDIKKGKEQYAFKLKSNSYELYRFGEDGYSDICVYEIGNNKSYCDYHSYEYNGEQNPSRDNYGGSNEFSMKRILVIQMN
ncbi:TLDc domain-containing protein [Entamoeba marina]